MSRLLWLGNPPWGGSGYGEQAAIFLPRLANMGHDVAVLCNWGLHGQETNWGKVKCYPSDGEWGNLHLRTIAEHWEADQVIALCDAWVLTPDKWGDVPPVAVWAPVDHEPIQQPVVDALAHERIRPIAMSRFGFDEMRNAGLDALYIPHGVDTKLFRPYPGTRAEIREQLGIPPDVFVAGMVAANTGTAFMSRKAFPQAFLAFTRFAETHPDAWLYVHTQAKQGAGGRGGLNLDVLAEKCKVPPHRLRFPPDEAWHLGIPTTTVALVYQALDCLLMPSMGEGFGVPLIEAAASGVPVITSDHSAMRELCHAGWLVDGDPWWDGHHASWYFNPHVDSIVAALEQAYEARGDKELRGRAVAFAASYDADLVAETYWKPALAELLEPAEVAA